MIKVRTEQGNSISSLFFSMPSKKADSTWKCPYCESYNSYMFIPHPTVVEGFGESSAQEIIETDCHFCRNHIILKYNPEAKRKLSSVLKAEEVQIPADQECSKITVCKVLRPRNEILGEPQFTLESILHCGSKCGSHQCIFTAEERMTMIKRQADYKKTWINGGIKIKVRNLGEFCTVMAKVVNAFYSKKIPYQLNDTPLLCAPFLFNDASWIISFEFHDGIISINARPVSILEATPDCIYVKNFVKELRVIINHFLKSLEVKDEVM